MSFEKILFYGIIIVGALLLIGLTYYRIDWARHPEKYQDLVEQAEKDHKDVLDFAQETLKDQNCGEHYDEARKSGNKSRAGERLRWKSLPCFLCGHCRAVPQARLSPQTRIFPAGPWPPAPGNGAGRR